MALNRSVREERRSDAAAIREAVFYDSNDRKRLWSLTKGLLVLCISLFAGLIIAVCGIFWLLPKTWHADTFGYIVHDNGDTTPLGPLRPGQPASVQEKRQVAGHFVADLFTVTDPADDEDRKAKVLAHVAVGSPAATFVDQRYSNAKTNPFVTYRQGYRQVSITDVDSDSDGSRCTVFYTVTPTDQYAQPTGPVQKYVAHLQIVQHRTGDEHVLWRNPDEVYTTYIDAEASDE